MASLLKNNIKDSMRPVVIKNAWVNNGGKKLILAEKENKTRKYPISVVKNKLRYSQTIVIDKEFLAMLTSENNIEDDKNQKLYGRMYVSGKTISQTLKHLSNWFKHYGSVNVDEKMNQKLGFVELGTDFREKGNKTTPSRLKPEVKITMINHMVVSEWNKNYKEWLLKK